MGLKKKIAQIEPVGGHGGMNYYDFGLCEALASAGHEVWLFTSVETQIPVGAVPFEIERNFRGIYGGDSIVRRSWRYLRGLLTSLRAAQRCGCSIVHLHMFHFDAKEFLTLLLARLYGFKVVATIHDVESFDASGRWFDFRRLAFALAHAFVVHNKVSYQEVTVRLGVPATKVEVIHHGNYLPPDSRPPDRDQACARLDLDPSKKWLLFFGQIKQVKGLDLLLAAMPAIIERHPDARIVIAGKLWKDTFDHYQSIIDANGVGAYVERRIGYVPDDLAALYYAAATMVVLPYRKIYQSGVLLMAMSYGRPVVASDLPGMTEVLQDSVDGLIFRSEDIADLASTVSAALDRPGDLNNMAARALVKVRDEYSWRGAGIKTSSLYQRLM